MRTIAIKLTQVYGAAPLDELLFDTNRYKETIRWTRIVGNVSSGQGCLVRLFVRVGGTEILVKQQVQGAALNSIQAESPLYLTGNYRIGMRATGADVGSLMELSAFGLIEDPVTV